MAAVDDLGIDKITDIISVNKSHIGKILEKLSKPIFIAQHKKPGANEYGLHLTISLMSRITKLIRILGNRARSGIKPELGQEQSGFVKDIGTRNSIFMLRMI